MSDSKFQRRIYNCCKNMRTMVTGTTGKENISYQLLPLIQLSRLSGTRPMSATTFINKFGNKSAVYNYSFSVKSWAFCPMIFCGIPTFLLWLLFFLNVGLSIGTDAKIKFASLNFPENNFSKLNYLVIRSLCVMIPISRIIEIVAVWISTPSLSSVLNNWNEIDEDLILLFRKFSSPSLKESADRNSAKVNIVRKRNILVILYVIIPTIGFLPFVSDNETFMLVGINSIIGTAICMCMLFSSITLSLLEDANAGIMYKCLAESFKQVRMEIENVFKTDIALKLDRIGHKDVQDLSKLVLKIRKQCELVGNNQAFQQVIPLAVQVVWFSLSLFVLVQNVARDIIMVEEQVGITYLCIGFTVSMVIRLVMQVNSAVEVTSEEGALAMALFDIHGQMSEIVTKMEVKNLFDLLMVKPSRISFWDYVIMNQAFLLGFVSQVTTLFIVLTQFDGQL